MGRHGISTSRRVESIAEWVILGGRLREPDVSSVSGKLAGFEGLGDVFFDNDGTTGGVDEDRS